MTALPNPTAGQQESDEPIDKSGAEYNIIIELTNWRTLATMSFNAFHGQEVGEDPEFDKLDKREREAYKALLAKIEAYAERLATQRAVEELEDIKSICMMNNVSVSGINRVVGTHIARLTAALTEGDAK